MLSNAYFLAKFRFDTAENEPAKNLQNFRKMHFSKMNFRMQSRDRLVALLLALVLERLVPLDAVLLEEDRLAVPVLLLRVEGAPVLRTPVNNFEK